MADAQYKPVEVSGKITPAEGEEDNRPPWGPYTEKKAYGQVTIRFPLNPHPLNLIALTYGFLPWAIPVLLGVYGIATWHFLPMYGVCMALVCAILNEAILKPILKQPRPKETAHRDKENKPKDGMPSGHVLNATVIMVWAILEVGLNGPGLDKDKQLTIELLTLILILCAPVPWARWFNFDHTLNQTLVSLVIGSIVGCAGFYVRVHFFSDPWKPWEDTDRPAMSLVTPWRPPWVNVWPALTTTEAPSHHGSDDDSARMLLL